MAAVFSRRSGFVAAISVNSTILYEVSYEYKLLVPYPLERSNCSSKTM